MAISCSPDDLAAAANCFQCLTPKDQAAIQTYLLAIKAGGSLDPHVLAEAARCFACYNPRALAQMDTYLLCQINNGGGGPCACSDQTGDAPPGGLVTPEFIGQLYIRNPGPSQTFYYSTGLTSADWTLISCVAGALIFQAATLDSFTLRGDGQDTSLSFPNATFVDVFDVENCVLTSISFPLLTGMNSFAVDNVPITSLNLSGVTAIGSDLVAILNCASLSSLNFDGLVTANGIVLTNNDSLTAIAFPAMTTVTNGVGVDGHAILTTINLSALLTVGSTFIVVSNPLLTTLNLSGLLSCGDNFTVNDSRLTSLTLPALTSDLPQNVQVSGNSLLTTFSMNGRSWVDGKTIDFKTNALNQASVDLIIHAGITGGMTSGSIDVSGVGNSTPSAAGQIEAGILNMAGCTVTFNP